MPMNTCKPMMQLKCVYLSNCINEDLEVANNCLTFVEVISNTALWLLKRQLQPEALGGYFICKTESEFLCKGIIAKVSVKHQFLI